jgi:putative transposase
LLWYFDNLQGLGTSLLDVDDSSSTSDSSKRKNAGSMQQLGQMKRQKSQLTDGDVETPSTASLLSSYNKVRWGSSLYIEQLKFIQN